MDGRRRKTVHAARRPEERPKDASHSSTFTECTAAMLTLPSFAGPTSARSVTRTVRMRFSVGTGAVWSAAVPGRRIWPPPGRRSWQYFLTWAGFCAVCCINLLLLLMHWNSWVFQSPLRFVVWIPLALLGGMLGCGVWSRWAGRTRLG